MKYFVRFLFRLSHQAFRLRRYPLKEYEHIMLVDGTRLYADPKQKR